MSDIVPTGETGVASFLSQQTDISDIPQRSGFLPYLAIAYGSSGSVGEGIAVPGDFVFEGKQSLGKKIEVIVADFRLHLSIWNETTSTTDSDCYSASNDPMRGKGEAYLAFKNQQVPNGCKLQEGVDLLLWIPSVSSFAVIYLKGTTYDSFAPIYTSGRGGRLISLSTRQLIAKKTGRKFYVIDCVTTNRAVVGSGLNIPGVEISCDVAIPSDFAEAAVKKFKNITSTEVVTGDAVVSDR